MEKWVRGPGVWVALLQAYVMLTLLLPNGKTEDMPNMPNGMTGMWYGSQMMGEWNFLQR